MMNKVESEKQGRYHNDYSPRYQKPYDIYEKAKDHMRRIRKDREEERNKNNE